MPRSQRARSARAIANDGAILDAAVSEVLRVGVDRVSPRDVGHQAGLSHGATYARYEDVDELLVDLWNTVLSFRAVHIFELAAAAAAQPSAETVRALVDFLREPSQADLACVEVLYSARRIPTLHEEVEPFVRTYLERRTSSPYDEAIATRTLVLFATTLLEIYAAAVLGTSNEYCDFLESLYLHTLRVDPATISRHVPREPDDQIVLHTSSDLRDQLSHATFGVVGKSGYTKATISRIARRAGCPPAAIYKHFSSKEDLIIAAFNDLMRSRWSSARSFVGILEEDAFAHMLFSAASTKNAVRQSFMLETCVASQHSEKIRDSLMSQMTELTSVIPLLDDVDDQERLNLHYLIWSISSVNLGVTFLATVTPRLEQASFNQFAEPYRRAILNGWGPTWAKLRSQLQDFADASSL